MKNFQYIENVVSLEIDVEKCICCGQCTVVCPHRLLSLESKKAIIRDKDACIECGACQENCPVEAVNVSPGVGCATYIIAQWANKLTGRKIVKGCC